MQDCGRQEARDRWGHSKPSLLTDLLKNLHVSVHFDSAISTNNLVVVSNQEILANSAPITNFWFYVPAILCLDSPALNSAKSWQRSGQHENELVNKVDMLVNAEPDISSE